MINLPPIIERIAALLAEDTDASVTYAALEARLALEKVCYDRLRQCHDYISHAQLKKWQPRQIVNTLLKEVDQHATQTRTLHISRNPARPGEKPEEQEYVEIGTEVGFDPRIIEKLWNALAKIALHVRLPEHKEDHIPPYGDKEQIRAKVEEVSRELERLSKTTMTFSGIGEEVSFVCECGEKNKRRASLLHQGQQVSCINPNCQHTYIVKIVGQDVGFEADVFSVICHECDTVVHIPRRGLMTLKYDQFGSCFCPNCNQKNFFQWRLLQVRPRMEGEEDAKIDS
ncbi:hypothetical protein ACFFV8_16540 [Sphingobium indicum]|uniref:Uncharacterized protein n=1 Tax=Sphingobium indicum F2 TaxID=1450518 RepID=A0A8E1C2K1_9SPHN|nr:hypothetical protein L286_11545 [Sphingobium sp. HDIP04]KER36322.1 hypothetical protein AL00_11270 [Sphingobium indicum F2]